MRSKHPIYSADNFEVTKTLAEKRLLLAVLERAVQDVTTHNRQVNQDIVRSARQWLHIDQERPVNKRGKTYFSFFQVCELLDKCPYLIHKNIKKLYEKSKIIKFSNKKSRIDAMAIIEDDVVCY